MQQPLAASLQACIDMSCSANKDPGVVSRIPSGARLEQVAMTSATHMHELCSGPEQCCNLGKCGLEPTATLKPQTGQPSTYNE